MAEGGEEKAVFQALKNDAQEALPKIAEKNAELVDTTVQKGTKALADHAATEASIEADLKAKMPKDPEPITATATEAAPAAETVPAADAGATQSEVAAENPVKGTKMQQTLEPDDGMATPATAVPKYDNQALRDGPSFDEQIDAELAARGWDRGEHDSLRLTRTNELFDPQAQEVVDIRNSIKIGDGQIVTKVIKPEIANGYLENDTSLFGGNFDPTKFQGSIARGTDTADLTSLDDMRDKLALDDSSSAFKWSPVPQGATEAYQLRFPAPADMRADPTLGAVGDQGLADHVANMAGQSAGRSWDDPFLGTGYTGGGVPEWDARSTGFPDGAEIWRMNADGTEEPLGYFDSNAGASGTWKNFE